MEFIYDSENFTGSKFDVMYVNTVNSKTQSVRVLKSNRVFGAKRSNIN